MNNKTRNTIYRLYEHINLNKDLRFIESYNKSDIFNDSLLFVDHEEILENYPIIATINELIEYFNNLKTQLNNKNISDIAIELNDDYYNDCSVMVLHYKQQETEEDKNRRLKIMENAKLKYKESLKNKNLKRKIKEVQTLKQLAKKLNYKIEALD